MCAYSSLVRSCCSLSSYCSLILLLLPYPPIAPLSSYCSLILLLLPYPPIAPLFAPVLPYPPIAFQPPRASYQLHG